MNGDLTSGARAARDAEDAEIWRSLRSLVADGVEVRRRHFVEGVELDYAIPASKVAIAIGDGQKPALREAERDVALTRAGWRVFQVPREVAAAPGGLAAALGALLGVLEAADETKGRH